MPEIIKVAEIKGKNFRTIENRHKTVLGKPMIAVKQTYHKNNSTMRIPSIFDSTGGSPSQTIKKI